MPSLTLAEAEKILEGAKAKLATMEARMCVAIVDARGDLKAMFRQDGAPWRSVSICQGKAAASAAWGQPSGDLTDRAQSPVFRGLMAMLDGRMIPGQGALPVFKDGEMVGAVGGSGGTSQDDEAVGRAGIEAAGLSTTG